MTAIRVPPYSIVSLFVSGTAGRGGRVRLADEVHTRESTDTNLHAARRGRAAAARLRGARGRLQPLPLRPPAALREPLARLRLPRRQERDRQRDPRRRLRAPHQRHLQPILAGGHDQLRAGGRDGPPHRVPGHARPLALAAHAHERLSHLPEHVRARHHPEGLSGLRLQRLQHPPPRQLRRARVLRAVPRDGLRLRLAPDGVRGHLLFLRARGRQAHARPRRRPQRVQALPNLPRPSTRRPSAKTRGARPSGVGRRSGRPGKYTPTTSTSRSRRSTSRPASMARTRATTKSTTTPAAT